MGAGSPPVETVSGHGLQGLESLPLGEALLYVVSSCHYMNPSRLTRRLFARLVARLG
jgi:hypothetical protein